MAMRTYEYRLYPRKAEVRVLSTMLAQACEVYNAALEECKASYIATKTHTRPTLQWPYFREWRKQPGIVLNAASVQRILRRVDKAYDGFFRRLKSGDAPGYPRFKSIASYKSIDYTYTNGIRLEVKPKPVLYVQNVGHIKIKLHRPLPLDGVIKSATVKRITGKWFVFFKVECDDVRYGCKPYPEIGVDMGLHSLVALSDGRILDNPRWLRKSRAELRVLNRRFARRKRGSARRATAAQQLAIFHKHIGNQRKDFWHKVTRYLVDTYGMIAIERLNLAFMTSNDILASSAYDAGLGMFVQFLQYKAESAGTDVIAVPPMYTSQMCSNCGALVEKDLKVRIHDCPQCEIRLDRDVNAARNILAKATS